MVFETRQEAGFKLGRRLQELAVEVDLVAGLPRGGVVVAAEVAEVLQRPLEALVVRKIGHPWHREFAVGALAEDNVLILDPDAMAAAPLAGMELEAVIQEEKERLRDYCFKFRRARNNNFAGHSVVLVDDGLATGATAEAAVYSAREKKARQIILAVPVASALAAKRLARVADGVVALITDPDFAAVGQYYKHFLPTSDEEVLALLHHQPADYRPAR
jgi:putative phosphoribosyl transferase